MNATRRALIVTTALCALPTLGAVDARLRTADYNADEVFRLRGQEGYQIDVQFEVGETFIGLGAGDLAGLAFFAQDNHLFIKPKAAGVVTNLTVITSRRHYQFEYATANHGEGVMYVLRFRYPPAPDAAGITSGVASGVAVRNRIDSTLAAAAANRVHNGDYWYCGAESLMPVAASDDGVHTRLRFAPRAEQPAVFVRNDDEASRC